MSALFRAELQNLQRLVASHEVERNANTNERERMRTQMLGRSRHLQAICGRQAKNNRQAIKDCLKRFSRPHVTLSANRVSELIGLSDESTRKHLRDMAEAGEVVGVLSASGKQTRYYLPLKK